MSVAEKKRAVITVRNIRGIEYFEAHLPVSGVVLFRGENDCGKTRMVDAVRRLTGDRTAPFACSNLAAVGSISGLGATVTIRKRATENGHVTVATLEDSMSIGTLIDPGIKDPAKADAVRIKACVRLSGAEADVSPYYELVGGKEAFDKVVSPESMATDCPVEMSARIHRVFLTARNSCQDTAGRAKQHEAACREAIGETDLTAAHDAEILQAELETAMEEGRAMNAQRDVAARAVKRADKSRLQLVEVEANYRGLTVEGAEEAVAAAKETLDEAAQRQANAFDAVDEAQRQLDAVTDVAKDAGHFYDQAIDHRDQAVQHDNLLAGCREAIDTAGDVESPSEEAMAEASRQLLAAKAANDKGVLVRQALEKDDARKRHIEDAKQARESAEVWANAADGTDDVLSRLVDSDTLTVRHGRLVTTHPTRGEVPFHERSEGTRCRLAILEAIRRLRKEDDGQMGVIPLPQKNWEGINPANQRQLLDCAHEHGVVIVSAEATDGPLRAEVFGEEAPLFDAETEKQFAALEAKAAEAEAAN